MDVWEAISLANLHPRIDILQPGPGVGGHCISVDPWFFVEAAPDLTPFIRAAREVNDAQPKFVVTLVERALGLLNGKKIAALGLSYKPDVDDLRESPAVEVVHLLQDAGARVKAFEPYAPNATLPNLTIVPTLEGALADADAVILLVAHSEFKLLDVQRIADMMIGRVAVDTVNGWDADAWGEVGFNLTRLGVNS